VLVDIPKRKISVLPCNLGMQVDLEQQITQFFSQMVYIVFLNRLNNFVSFL
jgi:hypothetical protein